MSKKTYQITKSGKQALEQELKMLSSKRGAVAEKIAAARDFGDLSENAEYDAAREEQGLLETRIAEIEGILRHASIITKSRSSKVGLGSVVELNSDNGKSVTYTVVGPVEADPIEKKISNESPIGAALLGKVSGDEVTIDTPKGAIRYIIAAVS